MSISEAYSESCLLDGGSISSSSDVESKDWSQSLRLFLTQRFQKMTLYLMPLACVVPSWLLIGSSSSLAVLPLEPHLERSWQEEDLYSWTNNPCSRYQWWNIHVSYKPGTTGQPPVSCHHLWPDLRKPSVWDQRAIHAMRVFSALGQKLSKFRFCHIHVIKPFF